MDGSGNTIFNLFLIAFLLFSNGFFVASEFAMVKVRKTRIEQLVNEGNFSAKIALEALKDLDKFRKLYEKFKQFRIQLQYEDEIFVMDCLKDISIKD